MKLKINKNIQGIKNKIKNIFITQLEIIKI